MESILGSILKSSWCRYEVDLASCLHQFEDAIDWAKAFIVYSPTLEGTGERAGHFVLKSISETNGKVPYIYIYIHIDW